MLIKFVRVPDIRLEISTCRVYDRNNGRGQPVVEKVDSRNSREDRTSVKTEKKIAGKAYRSVRLTAAFLETASSITNPETMETNLKRFSTSRNSR